MAPHRCFAQSSEAEIVGNAETKIFQKKMQLFGLRKRLLNKQVDCKFYKSAEKIIVALLTEI